MTRRALGGVAATSLVVPWVVGCSSGTREVPAADPPGGPGGPAGATAVPAGELVEPSRFRARLETARTDRSDGLVDWRTDWVLTWAEVPGAVGYTARFATSEGAGGRQRELRMSELRLDVAAGTSPPRRVRSDREVQLTFTASQLLVSVRATGPGGVQGPASAWYRVGEAGADGVPVPNAEAH